MEKCEVHNSLITDYTKSSPIYCPMDTCPYNNGTPLGWEAEGHLICNTKGFVEKSGLIKNLNVAEIA